MARNKEGTTAVNKTYHYLHLVSFYEENMLPFPLRYTNILGQHCTGLTEPTPLFHARTA
jgi:hypothetical protein